LKVATVKTRFSLRTLIATTACIPMFLAAFLWFWPGVTVTVHNGGISPLVGLQVHVTGKSYDLGNITSGSTKKCKVSPTSESHVEISYQLPDGTTRRHTVDCYFESGYRGTVEAEIQDGELIHSSQRIQLSVL
jgi:hypothetical protein